MKRFEYHLPILYLTPDNIVASERNKDIDLYRKESLFPPDCLIITRICFSEEHVGHRTNFIRFLTTIAIKYAFKHIGIESTNEKSSSFTQKLGFRAIDDSNYVATVSNLIDYFQVRDSGVSALFPKLFSTPRLVIPVHGFPAVERGGSPRE